MLLTLIIKLSSYIKSLIIKKSVQDTAYKRTEENKKLEPKIDFDSLKKMSQYLLMDTLMKNKNILNIKMKLFLKKIYIKLQILIFCQNQNIAKETLLIRKN